MNDFDPAVVATEGNGCDDQLMTVMPPSPFLTNEQRMRDEPAWKQLELWDRLRATFLGLDPTHVTVPAEVFDMAERDAL